MTEYKLSPDSQIEIGQTVYRLDSSFGTLAAIQEALRDDIVRILLRITELRQDEIATLISLATGERREKIGEQLLEVGIVSGEYSYIVSQLMAWLSVALAPKAGRQKKTDEMRAFLVRMRRSHSPGANIASSPLESSDTPQPNSGAAPSGT